MPDIYIDVDTAVALIVNILPLHDNTDFKTQETGIVYNQSGMALKWNFTTSAGVVTQTAVTPTTTGLHDWTNVGGAIYKIGIPASGGTINNDTEGTGYFSGVCDGVLTWRSPDYTFRAAGLNNVLINNPYSTTRGLTGTALPAAAANGAGGVPISDAGGLDLDGVLSGNTPQSGDAYGRIGANGAGLTVLATAASLVIVDTVVDGIQTDLDNGTDGLGALKTLIDTVNTDLSNGTDGLGALKALSDTLLTRLSAVRAAYLDKLNITGNVASSSEVTAIQNNTRVRVIVPLVMERPDSGSTLFKLHIYIYDENGNMEAPDSLPTITAENQSGTSRSANLGTVTLESTGHYSVTYDTADTHAIEQILFEWVVIENSVTRQHGGNSQIVDTTAVDFTTSDRTTLNSISTQIGTAGDGLGSVPWNSAWDVEVQSEANDALVDFFTSSAQLVDDFHDEVLTGGTHNVPDSHARRLRNLQEFGSYEGGAVFVDTIDGLAGTTDYESATNLNPVDTIADANVVATSLGLKRFNNLPGSSYAFAASQENQDLFGTKWTLALGNQSISGSHIQGATVSGVCTGAAEPEFHECFVNTVTIPSCVFKFCDIQGVITLPAGNVHFHRCAGDPGSSLDYGAVVANTTVTWTDFSGELVISNLGANGTDILNIRGHGKITFDSSCVGGTVNWDGHFTITDNSTTSPTFNSDDISTNVEALVATIGTAGAGLTEVGGMSTDMKAEVNAEIVDTLNADTYAEPSQGAPPATASIVYKLGYIYKLARNKSTQTATEQKIYADDGTTVDHKAIISDNGTLFTRGEFETGP